MRRRLVDVQRWSLYIAPEYMHLPVDPAYAVCRFVGLLRGRDVLIAFGIDERRGEQAFVLEASEYEDSTPAEIVALVAWLCGRRGQLQRFGYVDGTVEWKWDDAS